MYTPMVTFLIGMLIGSLVTFFISRLWLKTQKERDKELYEELVQGRLAHLSMDMFSKISSQLNQQNQQTIAQERFLSAQELRKVSQTIENMALLIRELETDRVKKFGELSQALIVTHRDHEALARLTHQLHSVIYQKQARGQWGERMAEDILRMAGFHEGVNYFRQQSLQSGNRPDFVFSLPKDLTVNMDVKFPLENYARYVNEENSIVKDKYMAQFISDVRTHIRKLSRKEYISPEENTLDYVIMFIPSDLIYSEIFQAQPFLLDEALAQRVVLCSPSTLYAVLAVMRQAIDNYTFERSTEDILRLMDIFLKEWKNYGDKMELFGRKLESIQKDYNELSGVRAQKLEKPLRQFRALLNSKDENNDDVEES